MAAQRLDFDRKDVERCNIEVLCSFAIFLDFIDYAEQADVTCICRFERGAKSRQFTEITAVLKIIG